MLFAGFRVCFLFLVRSEEMYRRTVFEVILSLLPNGIDKVNYHCIKVTNVRTEMA